MLSATPPAAADPMNRAGAGAIERTVGTAARAVFGTTRPGSLAPVRRAAVNVMGRAAARAGALMFLLTLTLALVAPLPAGAQESPARLTLERALEIARARNPDLNRARNGMDGATASQRRAWGGFLPRVNTRFSLTDYSSRTMTGQNDFGEPVQLENPNEYDFSSASGGVGASFTLFDGFARLNELQAARAGSRGAAAWTQAERVRVEAEVKQRFYAAIAADRRIEVEERLLAAAEERLEATRAMVDAGRATPLDTLGAEVEVAGGRMAVENARANAYQLELLLRESLGVGSDVTYELVGALPELVDPAGLDGDRLVQLALEANPLLRRAEAEAAGTANLADAARGSRWPTVQIGANLDRNISLPNFDQLSQFQWNRGLSFGISATLPVFSGFARSEEIAWASVDQANAEETLREMRMAVERQVLIALTNARSAFLSAQLGQRAAELARLRAETGQEGFRFGRVPFTVLQQYIAAAAQAERDALDRHTAYAQALAALDAAVGRPVALQ